MHHKIQHRLPSGVRKNVALRMASKQIQAGRGSCGPPLGLAADTGKPAMGCSTAFPYTLSACQAL